MVMLFWFKVFSFPLIAALRTDHLEILPIDNNDITPEKMAKGDIMAAIK